MPLYDFQCPTCNRVVEFATYEDNKNCAACCSPMRRLYAAPNIVIYYSAGQYLERAIEGKEQVPGMSRGKVIKTAATM